MATTAGCPTRAPANEITLQVSADAAATVISQTPVMAMALLMGTFPSCHLIRRPQREYVTAMTRVLLVEDDPEIGRLLRRNLTELGHVVTVATEGGAGLALAVTDEPQVVLLDLGLPDLGGQQVLEMLRGVSSVPVIVITAQDDDSSIVRALDAGADDYLTKPFGTEQLAARMRAVLRRTEPGQRPAQEVRIGELLIEPAARTVMLGGEPVDLSRKEYDLLWVLATRLGEVVTKRELLAEVWQLPFGGGDRTVDVHLSWLRRKLGETAAEPRYLQTVRGVGVRLVDPGTEH